MKRLAKKQSAAEQRAVSPDSEQKDQDHLNDPPPNTPEGSPSKSPSSLPSTTPTPTDLHESTSSSPDTSIYSPAVDASSPADTARPGPSIDLANRRGSLPALSSTFTFTLNDDVASPITADSDRARSGSSSVFEGVPDPALFRRRSMTSLHRLQHHPCAPIVAASNGIQTSDNQRQDFHPIVPPSLPPTFRAPRLPGSAIHHHHSPSTPAPPPMMSAMLQTNRSASFHVIPNEHRLHAFPHSQNSLMHQPYAFPPRPLLTPGPGPLPAADFSFGTSTPPRAEETQEEFDVRPYVPSVSTASYSVQATAAAAAGVAFSMPRLVRQDDDTDASTSYTGYSSRFGSIASVAESDTSAGASGQSACGTTSVSSASGSMGAWDGSDRWVEEGRRGSW